MTDALADAARRRSRESLAAVTRAVNDLVRSDERVTLRAVAERAGVSRNYIYTTPKAKDLVDRARKSTSTRGRHVRPESRSASEASLQTKLDAQALLIDDLEAEVTELRTKNQALVQEVINLQNPQPENVTRIRKRRG
ncbi:DUF6262 family protein [Microbacterium maritypicum]|uniref:DUF6262 family protein n=1 Tax=Microbacterium maritypicum TaxID=33918 RepID=UPI0026734BF1|nr:DUF6262 family protein [Microbacterium liquefaciens]WKT89576.1 DUF6262 family protein [Microbacterium liquefaciens]